MHKMRRNSHDGFSLVEMLVVVAIVLVVGTMALPNLATAMKLVRIRSSASEIAGLCQKARIQAVKDNKFYQVMLPATTANPQIAYVDIDGSNPPDYQDPVIQLGSNVTVFAGSISPPSPPALTSMNLDSTFTPQAQTSGTATNPWFNNRGLPCVPDSTTSPTLCTTQVGTAGYVIYLQDTFNNWSAVTILPSGRIKAWTWNGGAWD